MGRKATNQGGDNMFMSLVLFSYYPFTSDDRKKKTV